MDRKRRGFRVEAVGVDARSHGLHGDARKRGPGAREVDAAPAVVAQALGTSRRAAEVALWGPLNLARRCARVIAALKAAGADETLVRFIQPIDLAIHAARPGALTGDELPGAHPVPEGLEPPPAAPPREIAQAYLNRLYDDLELRAALRAARPAVSLDHLR